MATQNHTDQNRADQNRIDQGRADPNGAGRDGDANAIRLLGTLSAAPEVRELPSGDLLVLLKVVVWRADGSRVDSLPVVVGPPPARGTRRAPNQAGRREVNAALRLEAGSRVEVTGWLQRRFWDAGGARRSRLQVVATGLKRA